MKRGLPWESAIAVSLNKKIFKEIKQDALKASKVMSYERGTCPDGFATKQRNMHLLAIAPNANSSILCGCTASIEPLKSNCFVHRTRAGAHVVKNKYLTEVLQKYNQDKVETWNSIVKHDGSVQHLEFLDDYEKDTFKTAFEIDQLWVVEQAAARQPEICQGQSVNLFFGAGTPRSYVNQVHLKAWQSGLKGLYYLRTTAGKTGDKVGQSVERVALQDADECLSCHG
jgi:ribonucleoside-diphosphate reductase alpha chain